MVKKRHKPEEIVAKLRQVEVLTAQGKSIAEAVKTIAVTETTYFRWRAEYGGLKSDQVKRLKDLETENARLRKAVSDLTLEKLILKEAASGNWQAPSAVAPASSAPSRGSGFPSVSPAARSASIGRPSARSPGCARTKPL